ncbi:MAG: tRNA (guanosine(37)-N1)-methyltransferase TrmD [Parcubacteria group bacterium SW_4_49_11]|nr:MAG: tRNA (guanosine(37)-N1)-methyltransferase TrmD [Parcubacteria group bacterium SW_4_49_11]
MRFDVLTLFPETIRPYTETSILDRAREHGYADIHLHNLRSFTSDKHGRVDDRPFGGGAGMILQIEPIYEGLKYIVDQYQADNRRVILLGAGGERFTQPKAKWYQEHIDHCVLICGRYEGVDSRVEEHLADETLSIGEYVLTGGELPALVVMDAVTRLIPGVLGNESSLAKESFQESTEGEYPQYTRPASFAPDTPHLIRSNAESQWTVPAPLLSGDHQAVAEWRETNKRR